jgi:hypothetical protein
MSNSLPFSLDQLPDELEQIQHERVSPDAVQPVTPPVVPAAEQSVDEQQAVLIQELARLNALTDDLLQEQPRLETVFQQQLATLFPQLTRPINPNQIFYSRYREDEQGQKHLLSCETLGVLLNRLRQPDATTYLAQESGAFYRQPQTLEAEHRLSPASPTATMARLLEVVFIIKLNEFWRERTNGEPPTESQLVALRRQVLAHQLALATVDGTLSAAGRSLADKVLKYPSAAARNKAFAVGQRPGVYSLMLENGNPFASAFIINPTGGTPPAGSVMLYTPGEGFEEYRHLAHLNETVAARLRDGESAGRLLARSLPLAAQAELNGLPVLAAQPKEIEADVLAVSVRSLRIQQDVNVRATLRKDILPVNGELDIAADLAPQLDNAVTLAARNLRLVQPREPDWLTAASPADQVQYRQLEETMVERHEALLPLLERIPTQAAFSEKEIDRVLKLHKPHYANTTLAPYKSLVHLRITANMPVKVSGYRDDVSETVYISEDPKIDIPRFLQPRRLTAGSWNSKVVVDLRTLGSYAQRNVDPWSPHDVHRSITASADIYDASGNKLGALDNADLRTLAQQADVAKKYDQHLRSAFSPRGDGYAFATAWQQANTAQMRKEALESRLNPAVSDLFTFKTPGSGLDWIQAIIDHPDPATRPKVGRSDIEVNALVMGSASARGLGGQVINGALVIQRAHTRPGGVCVLYTPDAPDEAPFRELVNGLVELDTLKVKPEWRAYFTERMATNDKQELEQIFSDLHNVHRYVFTPITGDLQAYLYSAQLAFQLAHADYRSRSNRDIAVESTANAFMFAAETADFLLGLSLVKAMRRLLFRYVIRGLHSAQKLGRRIPGLLRKIGSDRKPFVALSDASIRPLTQAWVDIAEYRLPTHIDALFDVEDFAQTHRYTLSRKMGAPSFIDNQNNQFIAIKGNGASGRYYLHKSYVQDNARFVRDPKGLRPDFMVVPGDAKSWRPRFERTTRGGGSVLGIVIPRTAEQQLDDDLLAALRIYTPEHGQQALDVLTAMQKRRVMDSALQHLNVDEATFRLMVKGQRGLPNNPRLREALLGLQVDADICDHVNKTTNFLSAQLTLSPQELDDLFKKIKRIMGKNDDLSKYIRSSISIVDPQTKATFVGYAFTKKQLDNLNKFDKRFKVSTWSNDSLNAFLNEGGRVEILRRIAAEHNIDISKAAEILFANPQVRQALTDFRVRAHAQFLRSLGVASYSDEFKKSGIPYIALSQGERNGADSGIKVIDSITIAHFEKNIPRYSTPLEFTPPRATTHKVEKPPAGTDTPAVPTPPVTRDTAINIVNLDELAEAQLPMLPAGAKAKVEEIVEDIRAGRVSRKKIGSYTYVDLPQLDPGAGRGRWRVAIEKTGKEDGKDVFIVKGIIDYHDNKRTAWGV